MTRSSVVLAAVVLLFLVSSASAAVTEFTISSTSNTGRQWTSYTTFPGVTDKIVFTRNGYTLATNEEAKIEISCKDSIEVTPKRRCITESELSFSFSVKATATAGTISTPCTFSVVGTDTARAEIGVTNLNAALANAWTIVRTETLVHEQERLGSNSASNPTVVVPGSYQFNFSRSSGLLGNINSCQPSILCSAGSSIQSHAFYNGDVASTWSLSFPSASSVLQGTYWSHSHYYVYCDFTLSCSNTLDTNRYTIPSLYFKVMPKTGQITSLRLVAPDMTPSATLSTTKVFTITPTPTLYAQEWLKVTVQSCNDYTNGQGRYISPGFGADGTEQSSSKVWSRGGDQLATSNAGVAIILPSFTAGALFSTCTVVLTGSPSALLRYQLATDEYGSTLPISVALGSKVVLTPTFNPYDANYNPSNDHPVLVESTSRVRFVPDRSVITGSLRVNVDCGPCSDGDATTISSSSYSSPVSFRTFSDVPTTTTVADAPYYDFTANVFKSSSQTSGSITCHYSLSGEDAEYFALAFSSHKFNVISKMQFGITLNNGLNSPLLYSDLDEDTNNGYNTHRVAVADKDKTVLTVAAPKEYEVELGAYCDYAAVTATGAGAVGTQSIYTTLKWGVDSTVEGKFALGSVSYDGTVPSPGTVVTCSFRLYGRDANLFIQPPTITFFVGPAVPLRAVTVPGLRDGKYRMGGTELYVGRVVVNVTRALSAAADATTYNSGFRLGISCVSDEVQSYNDDGSIYSYYPATVTNIAGSTITQLTYSAGLINTQQFAVSYNYRKASTANVVCSFTFVTSSIRDELRFTAPDPVRITFQRKVQVVVSGNVISSDSTARYAVVSRGAVSSVDFTVGELPYNSDEEFQMYLSCPDAEIQPSGGQSFVFTTSTPSSRKLTYSFTAPTLAANTNRIYSCSVDLFQNDNSLNKWESSLASVTFSFLVGEEHTVTPSLREQTLYPGQVATQVDWVRSSCFEGGDWRIRCYRPTLDGSGEETVTGRLNGGTSTQTLSTSFPNPTAFTFTAPTDRDAAYDITCRSKTFSPLFRGFATPVNLVYHVRPRATFTISGMHGNRDLISEGEVMRLAVAPTEAPGKDGVGATLECRGRRDNADTSSYLTAPLFWFAGSTDAQVVEWKLDPLRTASPYWPGYDCSVVVDPTSGSIDHDALHYKDYQGPNYRIGPAVSFIVESDSFFYADKCEGGQTTVTVRAVGRSAASSVTLTPTCRRSVDSSDPGAPDVSTGGATVYFSADCNGEFSTPQTFTIYNNEGYEGPVTCTFTSSAALTALKPTAYSLYTGTEAPSESSSGLSGGAIAGIVIGTIAGVAIIAGLVYYFLIAGKSASAVAPAAVGDSAAKSTAGVEMHSQQVHVQAQVQLPEA